MGSREPIYVSGEITAVQRFNNAWLLVTLRLDRDNEIRIEVPTERSAEFYVGARVYMTIKGAEAGNG